MKTLDDFELKEGDECWVSLQCGDAIHNLSAKPRKAIYMNDDAKRCGVDFWCKTKCDCAGAEVIGVWKNKPVGQK